MELLKHWLTTVPHADFPTRSRIHRLSTFDHGKAVCYVKRDDELGFGCSGSKIRKYQTLIPYLCSENPDEALLIGSSFSNHILSMSQLLKERKIEPILFLLSDTPRKYTGNFFFSALVADHIHLLDRTRWKQVVQIVEDYAKRQTAKGKKVIIVPKGGSCWESLPGALSLGMDIVRNEEELGMSFDHLFIDSGTALTSIALLLVFAYFQKKTKVHVFQMAGTQEEFHVLLKEYRDRLSDAVATSIPYPEHFELCSLKNAPSYGSVNKKVLEKIVEFARTEGIMTDPIYTAKLFDEAQNKLRNENLSGNILIIHSGGGLSLCGFQDQLLPYLSKNDTLSL